MKKSSKNLSVHQKGSITQNALLILSFLQACCCVLSYEEQKRNTLCENSLSKNTVYFCIMFHNVYFKPTFVLKSLRKVIINMYDGEHFCMLRNLQALFLSMLDSSSKAEHSRDERYKEEEFKCTALHLRYKKEMEPFFCLNIRNTTANGCITQTRNVYYMPFTRNFYS